MSLSIATLQHYKMNFLKFNPVQKGIKKFYPDYVQSIFLIGFFVLLIIGVSGPSFSSKNPLTYIVWTLWWSLLPIIIFLSARAWCGICPLGTVSDILNKIKKFQKKKPSKFLLINGTWFAIILFLVISWLDWGYGITGSPRWTFLLFFSLLLFVAIISLLYPGRIFCKSLCPLKPLLSLYTRLSFIRYKSKNIKFKKPFQCPMYISPVNIKSNKDCILCFKCFREKEKGEYILTIEPPGRELIQNFKYRADEKVFLLILGPLVFLQTLQMSKIYPGIMKSIFLLTPFKNFYISFSFLFIILITIFVFLYLFFKLFQKFFLKEDFEFLYVILPLVFGLHLFHSFIHLVSDFREKLGLNPPGREWIEIGSYIKLTGGLIIFLGFLWGVYLIVKNYQYFRKRIVPFVFTGSVLTFYFILIFMKLGLTHIH